MKLRQKKHDEQHVDTKISPELLEGCPKRKALLLSYESYTLFPYVCMSVQIPDGVSQGWFLLTFSTHSPQSKLPIGNEIGSFWGKGRFYLSENVAFGTDLDDPLSSHRLRQRRHIFPNVTSSFPLNLLISLLKVH